MKPPDAIYLQWHGVDKSELMESELRDGPDDTRDVTWCSDKINDSDIRYVIDKRYRRHQKERP